MKITRRALTVSLLAGAVAATVPLALYARGDMGGERCDGPAAMHRGAFGGEHGGHGGFGEFGGGGRDMMRMLHGLDLTEAQRDKVFELVHANMPALREQGKVLRNNHEELRKLALSDKYDEAKVKALTEQNAQAMAQMAQTRARMGHEVYQLLTPEQRKALEERQAKSPAGRHGGHRMWHRGDGMRG